MTTTELTWQDIPKKLRDKISVTARRGAKLLDKEMLGWHDKIDVGRLDMRSGCNCVYGQLDAEGVFREKLDALGKPRWECDYFFGYDLHNDVCVWIGYADDNRWPLIDLACGWLQEEWLREIHTRREAGERA